MKRPHKFALLALTGITAISALLWMRSLASWRPQKIGTLPKSDSPISISKDGRLVMAIHRTSIATEAEIYKNFDLKTGRSQQWSTKADVGDDDSWYEYGWAGGFYWSFKRIGDSNFSLQLKDATTKKLKHLLDWGTHEGRESPLITVIGQKLCVFSGHDFREFDLATDSLKRKVVLSHPLTPVVDCLPRYAISLDGKTLYGCCGPNGAVWESQSGRLLKRWTATGLTKWQGTYVFSPDGRVVVYVPLVSPVQCHFVDGTTGKLLWTGTIGEPINNLMSDQDSEIALTRPNSCEVRDLWTGHLNRQLPGPRSNYGHILRVTHDWTYTVNAAHEICRWRAR